jgi:hypothetical protein
MVSREVLGHVCTREDSSMFAKVNITSAIREHFISCTHEQLTLMVLINSSNRDSICPAAIRPNLLLARQISRGLRQLLPKISHQTYDKMSADMAQCLPSRKPSSAHCNLSAVTQKKMEIADVSAAIRPIGQAICEVNERESTNELTD